MPQLTTFRLYLLGIALLFAGYVTLEYNRPKPLDWSPTYANKDKIPYGTYVVFDQLPHLLGTDSVEAVRLPVYNQLTGQRLDEVSTEWSDSDAEDLATTANDSSMAAEAASPSLIDSTATASTEQDSSEDASVSDAEAAPSADRAVAPEEAVIEEAVIEEDEEEKVNLAAIPLRDERANYLFINKSFELSSPDAFALLQFVARGNDAFIAAESFNLNGGASSLLRDSLGLEVKEIDFKTHQGPNGLPVADSIDLRFTNPALAAGRYRLPGSSVAQHLVVDAGRVGSTLATDPQNRAVFIRLNHGRGHIYLCTVPAAFTNYYLLRPRTAGFAAAALAYLPARLTWWDEYQKQGPVDEQSLLRVIFDHEALRAAYFLSLAGGLLFVLITARRRQRIIPTIKPLPNTTLLFTRTVASLYQQGRSHGLIAEKKVSLFLDYLRTHFQENNPDLGDEAFRERLAQKSGLPRPRVDELLRLVNFARTAPQVTDRELMSLSRAINDFRREARR